MGRYTSKSTFPIRYYCGELGLSGQTYRFDNAPFFPTSADFADFYITDKRNPWDHVEIRPKSGVRVDFIQYSIACLHAGEYLVQTFNHPFERDNAILFYNSAGNLSMTSKQGHLLKLVDARLIFDGVNFPSGYKATQFIA